MFYSIVYVSGNIPEMFITRQVVLGFPVVLEPGTRPRVVNRVPALIYGHYVFNAEKFTLSVVTEPIIASVFIAMR
jgi:hypothetical protein